MQRAATFLGSSIGKKVVMAVTGLVLFGFVIGHMIGNLQIYLGPEGAQRLRGVPAALPARRGHLDLPRRRCSPRWASTSGRRRPSPSRTGRPARSATATGRPRESTYASRTMRWSGPILAALHRLPPRSTSPSGTPTPSFVEGDVYHNVVVGLPEPVPVSAFYIARHAARSACTCTTASGACCRRSASATRAGTRVRRTASLVLAGVVVLGNISIPVAVLPGVVHL